MYRTLHFLQCWLQNSEWIEMRLKGQLRTFPAKIICVLIEFETFFHNLFEHPSLAAAQNLLSASPPSQIHRERHWPLPSNENHTAYHSTLIPMSPSTANHLFSVIFYFRSHKKKKMDKCKTDPWCAQGFALKLGCVFFIGLMQYVKYSAECLF